MLLMYEPLIRYINLQVYVITNIKRHFFSYFKFILSIYCPRSVTTVLSLVLIVFRSYACSAGRMVKDSGLLEVCFYPVVCFIEETGMAWSSAFEYT